MEDVIRLVIPVAVFLEFGTDKKTAEERTDFFNTHLRTVLKTLNVPEATITGWLQELTKPRSPPRGCPESGTRRAAALFGHLALYLSGACANCAHEDCVHQETCFDHVEARVNERVSKNAGNL